MEPGDAVIILNAGRNSGKFGEVKRINGDGTIDVTVAEIEIDTKGVRTNVTELNLQPGQYRNEKELTRRLRQLKA